MVGNSVSGLLDRKRAQFHRNILSISNLFNTSVTECHHHVDEEDEDDEDDMGEEDDETEEEAVDRIRGEISDRYDTDSQVIKQLEVRRKAIFVMFS